MALRRSLAAAMAALAVTPVLTPITQAETKGSQSGRPMLIYACDRQSEPCKVWQQQWQPLFAASPAYKLVDLRTVIAPTAKALLKPAAWPADLHWVLDTFLMSQAGQWEEYDTPRFFLLQNGHITASTAGNNGWRDFMWPTILDVTNTKP